MADDVIEVWTEPLGRQLYRLHVTVTHRFMEKLEAARDALAIKKLRRKADVLEAALDLVLERRRRGEGKRAGRRRTRGHPRTTISLRV